MTYYREEKRINIEKSTKILNVIYQSENQGMPLYVNAVDFLKLLGYKSGSFSGTLQRHVTDTNIKLYRELVSDASHVEGKTKYIDKEAVTIILAKCTKPQVLIVGDRLAQLMGAKFNIIVPRHEQTTISSILKMFAGEDIETQYPVRKPNSKQYYRIDLYFTYYRIAVECDEHNHADRNPESERKREEHITMVLGCTFVRFNPNGPNFELLSEMNRILRLMFRKKN